MKHLLWLLITAGLLLVATIASAQTIPDRQAEAQVIADAHPDLWQGAENKRKLTLMMCVAFNRTDNGLWGLLSKDDRNPPYVPEDILVWRPTLEHVDVMSDSGTVPWIVHPAIPAVWSWKSCSSEATPEPTNPNPPNPGTPPPTSGLDKETLERVIRIEETTNETLKRLAEHESREAMRHAEGASARDVLTFIGKYIAPAIGGILAGRTFMGDGQ